VRVEDLDVPAARAFVRWLRVQKVHKVEGEQTIAGYTVRNVVATLAALLDDAEGEGWIVLPKGNVARAGATRKELPEAAPRAGRSQILRVPEVATAQRLLDCADVPLRRRVRYAVELTSGLRDGEVSGLRWSDLALDEGVGHVRQAVQLKGEKGWAKPGKTKTRDSVRTWPLHSAAVAALKEWREEGWADYVGRKPRATDYVFPNDEGGPTRPRSADFFRTDAEACGIDSQVEGHALTFHALRRSYATWLAETGAPKEARDRLLGHVPRSTGERHYTEQGMGELRGWVERIGLRWGGTEGE
jgi:integrase